MGTSAAHLPYKPRTIYRDLLPPSEKRGKKIVTVWPESTTVPSQAVGTHVTIPGTTDPGARDNGRWNFVEIGSGVERDDMGECKTLAMRSISSRRNAMDVIGLCDEGRDEVDPNVVLCPAIKTSTLFERGFFVPEGDDPTEDELRAAEVRRDKYLDIALAAGDRAWNVTKDFSKIPGEAFIASRMRNITNREWSRGRSGEDHQECPACGGQMKKGKPLCPGCKETIMYEASGRPFWPKDPARLKAAAAAAKG